MMSKPKVIAFYLPQYYPIKENNKWFGEGFTEWTNVGKAKPLFHGHYQPKVPADLGYYDLRLPEIREAQVQLAKEAGIYGFCYWHYWFGNGKRLLNRIWDEVIETGKPDFPICLGWANHSWIAKNWDNRQKDETIMEQTYPGEKDFVNHFNLVLKAFKDNRYIKINNKPVFFIFKPLDIPEKFFIIWNNLAVNNGFDGICFIGRAINNKEIPTILAKGINYVTVERLNTIYDNCSFFNKRIIQTKNALLRNYRNCFNYKDVIKYLVDKKIDSKEYVIPMIIPNWDHSPRSKGKGVILHNSSPYQFYLFSKEIIQEVKTKPIESQIIILKSWNEWGEGNYMEPDLRFGKAYIKALKAALDEKEFY